MSEWYPVDFIFFFPSLYCPSIDYYLFCFFVFFFLFFSSIPFFLILQQRVNMNLEYIPGA